MSLSPEERAAIETALRWNANMIDRGASEAIWIAAKNWAFEQAAKAAKEALAEKMNVGPMWIYHRNVERDIRRLKDKHG